MPAEKKEVDIAISEGINFLFQNNISKIIGKEKVEKLELIKTELVKKENETREVPINIKDSNYLIDTDYVIMALGSIPDKEVKTLNLKLDKFNNIEINGNYQTSKPNIFAGGNIVGTTQTVAWASYSGREAAYSIIEYLKK